MSKASQVTCPLSSMLSVLFQTNLPSDTAYNIAPPSKTRSNQHHLRRSRCVVAKTRRRLSRCNHVRRAKPIGIGRFHTIASRACGNENRVLATLEQRRSAILPPAGFALAGLRGRLGSWSNAVQNC